MAFVSPFVKTILNLFFFISLTKFLIKVNYKFSWNARNEAYWPLLKRGIDKATFCLDEARWRS